MVALRQNVSDSHYQFEAIIVLAQVIGGYNFNLNSVLASVDSCQTAVVIFFFMFDHFCCQIALNSHEIVIFLRILIVQIVKYSFLLSCQTIQQ